MSTELKPVEPYAYCDNEMALTQYLGPDRGGDDRKRLQLTQKGRYVTVSKEQARRLALALLQWADDEREPEV